MMRTSLSVLLAISAISLIPLSAELTPAFAYGWGMDDFELSHQLTIGGGVTSPSTTLSLYQNPAGLAYNQQTKIVGDAWTPSNALNSVGGTGGMYFGNGFVGAGVAFNSANFFTAGSSGDVALGLAAEITSWNLSFGASVDYTLWNGGGAGLPISSTWGLDLGMIYNPHGPVSVGVMLPNVLGGVNTIGIGISGDANDWARFVLDAGWSPSGSAISLKPGLGIHIMEFQLTGSYGFAANGGFTGPFSSGTTIGLGFPIATGFHFDAYYNELSLYYAGLKILL